MANSPWNSGNSSEKWKQKGIAISWSGLVKTLRDASEANVLWRLMYNTEAVGDCWIKRGASMKGYPVTFYRGAQRRAHRVSFELFKSDIPTGMLVRHGCDTPRCVNPSHLLIGTAKDNTHDAYARRRAIVGSASNRAKINESQVVTIRQLRADGLKLKDIAIQFGLSEGAISVICARKKWKHVL